MKPSCRKSWAWESFDVTRFDLWSLLQAQIRICKIKVLITRLFLFLEVTSTYSRSDFTLGFSKVKLWLIGFGEFLSGGYNLHRFSDALDLGIGCITYWLMLIISRWPAG